MPGAGAQFVLLSRRYPICRGWAPFGSRLGKHMDKRQSSKWLERATDTPWLMAGCAVLLGLTLGCVQPMIMSTLHHLTPDSRHGEALAFRSMAINASSTLMPLLFGAVGTVVGAAVLFWAVGGAVGAGSWVASRLEAVRA